MRIPKFRIWDGSKMWYPETKSPDGNRTILKFFNSNNEKSIGWGLYDHLLDNRLCSGEYDKLMQFTGPLDKSGKDIYEGELLRIPATNEWEKKNYVAYEVFYHDNDSADKHVGFQMNRHHFQGSICGTSDFRNFLPKNTNKMISVGNVHQNPEIIDR